MVEIQRTHRTRIKAGSTTVSFRPTSHLSLYIRSLSERLHSSNLTTIRLQHLWPLDKRHSLCPPKRHRSIPHLRRRKTRFHSPSKLPTRAMRLHRRLIGIIRPPARFREVHRIRSGLSKGYKFGWQRTISAKNGKLLFDTRMCMGRCFSILGGVAGREISVSCRRPFCHKWRESA